MPPRPSDANEYARVLARLSVRLSSAGLEDVRSEVDEARQRSFGSYGSDRAARLGWERSAVTLTGLLSSGVAASVGIEEDVRYALRWVAWAQRGYHRDPHQVEKRRARTVGG